MGAGSVETGVAAGRDVHHRRDVPFHHLLVDRIPVSVGQRRARPVAAGRIGVEIEGDEAVVPDACLELGNTSLRIDAGALRQHRRANEMVGKQLGDAIAQLVADRGPGRAHGEIADVMGHEAGAGAEDRQIAAALPHQAQLVRLDQLAKLVVANLQFCDFGGDGGVLDAGDLPIAPRLERLGSGRVMPVAIDDHARASWSKTCNAEGRPSSQRGLSERIPGRPLSKFEIVDVDSEAPSQSGADRNHDNALGAQGGEAQAANKIG